MLYPLNLFFKNKYQ